LKNPLSPKLLVSGNMSQSKTTGSPKSPKSLDDNSKSGSSPSSIKSSPGNNKSFLAEKLAQSVRVKPNPLLKSPVSKSSPTSPNTSWYYFKSHKNYQKL